MLQTRDEIQSLDKSCRADAKRMGILVAGDDSRDIMLRSAALARTHSTQTGPIYLLPGFDDASLRAELGPDTKLCHVTRGMAFDTLIVTSLEALVFAFRLDIACDRLVLWASPEIDMATPPEIRSSAIASLSAAGLQPLAPRREDAASWADVLGVDGVPVLHVSTMPSVDAVDAPVTPLIDKTGLPRILVDCGGHTDNLSLIRPLMELRSHRCEIWVHYDGQLKAWMDPDYQIPVMPVDEIDMHLAAVDAMLAYGTDALAPLRLSRAFASGVVPLTLDGTAPAYATRVEAEFFGSNVLGRLLSDPKYLRERGDAARTAFARNTESEREATKSALETCGISACEQAVLRRGMNHALKLHVDLFPLSPQFDARIPEPTGATEGISDTKALPVSEATLLSIRGWALADHGLAETEIVLSPSGQNLITGLMSRESRLDVKNTLGLDAAGDFGFTAKFLLPEGADGTNIESALAIVVSSKTGHAAPLPRVGAEISQSDAERAVKLIRRIKSIDGNDLSPALPQSATRQAKAASNWVEQLWKRDKAAAVSGSEVSSAETVVGFVEHSETVNGLAVRLQPPGISDPLAIFELEGWEPNDSPLPSISAFLEIADGEDLIETKVMRVGRTGLSISLDTLTDAVSDGAIGRLFLPRDQFVRCSHRNS